MSEPAPLATVRTLDTHAGKRVELRGWVYKTRAKGKLCFLHVRDGSGIVQTVIAKITTAITQLQKVTAMTKSIAFG